MPIESATTSSVALAHQRTLDRQHKLNRERAKMQQVSFKEDHNKIVKKNEQTLKITEHLYKDKIRAQNINLSKKLNRVRHSHQERMRIEKVRLDQEMSNYKEAHNDKMEELKKSFESKIQNTRQSNQETLNVAKEKFQKSMTKYQITS